MPIFGLLQTIKYQTIVSFFYEVACEDMVFETSFIVTVKHTDLETGLRVADVLSGVVDATILKLKDLGVNGHE